MESDSVKQQVKDFHEHQPLVLNEAPWHESKRTECSACGGLLSGQSYCCAECQDFHLHKTCAEAPSEVNHLPVYQDHSCLSLEREVGFTCFVCLVSNRGHSYYCNGSGEGVDVCMKCALFMLDNDDNNEKLKVDYHPHPLLVVANHKDEWKRNTCHACKEALSDSMCVCVDCELFLHKECTHQLLSLDHINHPCHRRHPLYLNPQKEDFFSYICEICRENVVGLSYGCSSCKFYIHPKCAFLGSFNNIADETHQHTFNFLWKGGSFICEACGTEGHYASKVCSTCHINVHVECTSLPRLIRIVRHPQHSISHNYFVKENGLRQKHPCRICYKEVKQEYGCYSCSKEDCNYIVHVKCAIERDEYQIVNKDDPEELVEESFRIIERNDNGGAVKIQHFAHDHYLILGDKIKEGDAICCDGCMTFLAGEFYYCSQCDFFLHKTCAELPKKKSDWFHGHPITLEFASTSLVRGEEANPSQASILPCHFCLRVGSGLFYFCYECNSGQWAAVYNDPMIFCLRCASLPDARVHPGHEHLIFFDRKYEGKCAGCGDHIYEKKAFRCGECDNYGLDFKCMTLPIEAAHKCDKHLLRLVYGDENDDSEKHYCDVCEGKRNPNHWFYFCSICDNSVHRECILGEYPFIKIGSLLRNKDVHPHPLTLVKEVYYYPACSECGRPCLDLALECAQSECNYIVHLECLSDSSRR